MAKRTHAKLHTRFRDSIRRHSFFSRMLRYRRTAKSIVRLEAECRLEIVENELERLNGKERLVSALSSYQGKSFGELRELEHLRWYCRSVAISVPLLAALRAEIDLKAECYRSEQRRVRDARTEEVRLFQRVEACERRHRKMLREHAGVNEARALGEVEENRAVSLQQVEVLRRRR